MEKQLNSGFKLSLKQMALRKVAVNVWNETDVLTSIEKYRFKSLSEDFENIWLETVENKVKDKVSKLVLPDSSKKQIMHLVRPIGLDLLSWKIFHERILSNSRLYFNVCTRDYFDICILEKLCYTHAGTIDYPKTADNLLRHLLLDVEKQYKLACLYCLVDYIAVLWEKLPAHYKKRFYNGLTPSKSIKFWDHLKFNMEQYWAFILNEEESTLDNLFRGEFSANLQSQGFRPHAFANSSYIGNKSAAKYFFQRLTNEERHSSVLKAVYSVLDRNNLKTVHFSFARKYGRSEDDFPTEKHADILCYLLSLMNQEQQMHILKKRPFDVLHFFLRWPWLDLFLDIADVIWTFLPESRYDEFLELINTDVIYSDYHFSDFFQNFFSRSPRNFRKLFVSRSSYYCFSEFFNAEDTEIIKVIFRNLDVEDRMMIVSSYNFFRLLNRLMIKDKWHLVKLCLQEATMSETDKGNVKKAFMGFLTGIDSSVKPKWEQVFQFLEETDASFLQKRSCEDEMPIKVKKICNEE